MSSRSRSRRGRRRRSSVGSPTRTGSVPAMELYDAMRSAPTSRRFTAEPVERAALVRALDAARFAPSGGNRQGWRLVVVTDRSTREALQDLYLPPWRSYLELTGGAQMLAEPDAFDPRRTRIGRLANEYAEKLAQGPVHIVLGVRIGDLAAHPEGLSRIPVLGRPSGFPVPPNPSPL